jgi:hypothetical protein
MEPIDTKIMYFAVEKWQTNDFPSLFPFSNDFYLFSQTKKTTK